MYTEEKPAVTPLSFLFAHRRNRDRMKMLVSSNDRSTKTECNLSVGAYKMQNVKYGITEYGIKINTLFSTHNEIRLETKAYCSLRLQLIQ